MTPWSVAPPLSPSNGAQQAVRKNHGILTCPVSWSQRSPQSIVSSIPRSTATTQGSTPSGKPVSGSMLSLAAGSGSAGGSVVVVVTGAAVVVVVEGGAVVTGGGSSAGVEAMVVAGALVGARVVVIGAVVVVAVVVVGA